MTDEVVARLAERGYWRVEIRPRAFAAQRVHSTRDLQRIIEKCRVELRGWDFPHFGNDWDLPESQQWLGVETNWSSHVEIWRAYVSGQFIFRGGVWTDWLDQHHFRGKGRDWQPKTGMPLVSSLWSISEFWEFAARYSQSDAGDDHMYVSVEFHGLKGRNLFGDHPRRHWSFDFGPARMDDFVFSRSLMREDLIASAGALAVECATDLFGVFGYEASPDVLSSIQAELLHAKGRA